MKKAKKLVSLLVAVVLTLSMSFTVFADSENTSTTETMSTDATYTITIDNSVTGHTYEAYQIFSGVLSKTTTTDSEGKEKVSYILSNIEWGNGVDAESLLASDEYGIAAVVAEKLSASTDAKDFASAISSYLLKETPYTSNYNTNDSNYTITGLSAGYYLIKDKDGSLVDNDGNPVDDVYTRYIIQVVGDQQVEPKSSKTTSQKKVKDINDSTETELSDWQDTADHDIGDVISFQLSATVADTYDDYEKYELVFHDEESEGLTFNSNSVKVFVDGTLIYANADDTINYTLITEPTDGCTFEIKFEDLNTVTCIPSGSTNYENPVKKGSVITVEYTSTLNENAVIGYEGNPNNMYVTYSNNPNDKQGGTGKTPVDTAIVFTYELIVDKVDSDIQPLKGAEFTLYKKIVNETLKDGYEYKAVGTYTLDDETESIFTWKGLDDGDYKLEETKTPSGYNTIEPITFTVAATHGEKVNLGLDELVVKDVKQNDASGKEQDITVGDDGEATFTVEKVVITELVSEYKGTIETTVVNNSGATLPDTGGTGVKVLYTVGAILVIGAAVLLITRRRMKLMD